MTIILSDRSGNPFTRAAQERDRALLPEPVQALLRELFEKRDQLAKDEKRIEMEIEAVLTAEKLEQGAIDLPKTQTRFDCPKCGHGVRADEDRFCIECGRPCAMVDLPKTPDVPRSDALSGNARQVISDLCAALSVFINLEYGGLMNADATAEEVTMACRAMHAGFRLYIPKTPDASLPPGLFSDVAADVNNEPPDVRREEKGTLDEFCAFAEGAMAEMAGTHAAAPEMEYAPLGTLEKLRLATEQVEAMRGTLAKARDAVGDQEREGQMSTDSRSRVKHGCTADPTMPGTVDESTGPAITTGTAPVCSVHRCEWQECEARSVIVRNTPWGDLLVCAKHYHEPLFDERDLGEGYRARR